MSETAWLRRYYHGFMNDLRPSVIDERKKLALVMLRRKKEVAYVIIPKNGKHNFSVPIALHEGFASPVELQEMKQRLILADP